MSNRLFQLRDFGQSVWFDSISRQIVRGGELRRMIDDDAVVGVTSNPTIFEKAISGSSDYDESLRRLLKEGKSAAEAFEAVAVEDITEACDALRPVFEQTRGLDGYVSIEVSPHLAHETEASISEGLRLRKEVGRSNLMVKIPGTEAGFPAIQTLTAQGVNVNVTLLFSLEAYEHAAQAYIAGLEERVQASLPIEGIRSVASFFVSRVDTHTDKRLRAIIDGAADDGIRGRAQDLLGKAAIANARLAYQRWENIFGGARFQSLRDRGSTAQRCLWASTSTKDASYPDTYYVDNLIGPETINTLPAQTITAFKDHGVVARTLDRDVDQAHAVMRDLAALGISMDDVTEDILDEGVRLFSESYDKVIEQVEAKASALAR